MLLMIQILYLSDKQKVLEGVKRIFLTAFILVSYYTTHFGQIPADHLISFDRPALHFTESLPLGNGRLGAMIFGGTARDRIVLNEISMWSGGPQDADNREAFRYLQPIRNALLAGDNQTAQELLQEHFVAKGPGSGNGRGAHEKYGCYQVLGDLLINWFDTITPVRQYSRRLDLRNAVATTSYSRGRTTYQQEVWTDFVRDIIFIRITASKKKVFNLALLCIVLPMRLYQLLRVPYSCRVSFLPARTRV